MRESLAEIRKWKRTPPERAMLAVRIANRFEALAPDGKRCVEKNAGEFRELKRSSDNNNIHSNKKIRCDPEEGGGKREQHVVRTRRRIVAQPRRPSRLAAARCSSAFVQDMI